MDELNLTVLFVEDEENDIILTRRALRKLGLSQHARFVRNGFEMMNYLLGSNGFENRTANPLPDVIITDLKMPKCGGFEAIEWLHQHSALHKIPIVVLTSSEQEKDIKQAEALGVRMYLRKPADYHELQDLLAEVLQPWLRTRRRAQDKPINLASNAVPPIQAANL